MIQRFIVVIMCLICFIDHFLSQALTKEIVRSRKTVNRLYENKAQLNSVSMHLGESVGISLCTRFSLFNDVVWSFDPYICLTDPIFFFEDFDYFLGCAFFVSVCYR